MGITPQNQTTTLDFDATISSLIVSNSVAVTITGSRTLTLLGDEITIGSGAGLTTINSNLVLLGSSPAIAVHNSAGVIIDGSVSVTDGLTKSGDGMLRLNGTNTYTGTTNINGGILSAGAPGSLGSTTSITVDNGGTLLLSQSRSATTDRISDSSTITLNGGTFNTGGLSEHNVSGSVVTPGIGALTLTASSFIDLAAGASVLSFADSSAQVWNGVLSVLNWSGKFLEGGGTDQLYFGTDASGLTQTQLGQIAFYSNGGASFLGTASFASGMNGEIVPVPEPSTWIAGVLALSTLASIQRRPIARLLASSRVTT